jgi:formamidopyrimidine-DNA glycosylase
MPELPEVETVRRDLLEAVVGRPVRAVEVTGARTVRRTSAAAVTHGLQGTVVLDARRRGKYLLLPLDSGDTLVVHLRMSGKLLLAAVGSPRPNHTHVVLGLDEAEELRFVDPRTFGEVVVLAPGDPMGGLDTLGPDVVDDLGGRGRRRLSALLASTSRQMKYLLTDQTVVAGLGNIYADEVLHRAGVAPWRASSALTEDEVRRLHRALRAVLAEAIERRGSSLGDGQYVDLWGKPGSFQERHRAYGRAGLPCGRCRTPIAQARWAGRTTCWCPTCQT